MQGSDATRAVPGTRFTRVRWVAETGSTNADLLAEAARGLPEGAVVVADHQTAGRGRLDRSWTAPPGAALLVSVLLRPPVAPPEAFVVALAGGVAACEACAAVADVRPGLKWPNDLVVAGPDGGPDRKLAGLLAESVLAGGELGAVVLGMGLNLRADGLAPELAGTAAALEALAGRPVDRRALLEAWLRRLDAELDQVATAAGRAGVVARARARSATLGRPVRVERGERAGGELVGEAVDLTVEGHLVVAPSDGSPPVAVAVGDVVHLRPLDR